MQRFQIGDCHLAVRIEGSGRPVLFVHGFPLHQGMWEAQIEALSNSYQVIVPDLRGFGESDAVAEPFISMDQFADDLASLLDVLQIDEPVVYCGLSMGGYIGWSFVRRHSEKLAALILCDSRAASDSPEAAKNRRRIADSIHTTGAVEFAESMLPKLVSVKTIESQPHLVTKIRTMMHSVSPHTISAVMRGMADRPDSTELLSQINLPALLICGEEDAITPPEEMRQMAAEMPDAEFHLIQSAGHMAPLEQSEAVNSVLTHFLNSI